MDYSLLGKRIRMRRKQLHLTQVQLAEIIGFSSTYIGHLERGNRAPSVETFLILAKALGVTPDYLFQDYIEKDDIDSVFPDITYRDLESLERITKALKEAGIEYDNK